MLKLNDILDLVKAYNHQADLDLIRKAYVCSATYHAGQMRKSGEPYLSHPLEVAKILAELKLDEASICTGLLHDTVEDTKATKEEIEALFGADIANLVDGVTKLSQISFHSTEEKQAENFRKMLVAMSKDIRVLLVKLADRLHNMRTLQYMPQDKQERIATETMEIYAPLANRLGINWLKAELEDLSFKYIKPWDYRNLREKVGKTKKERTRFIEEVLRELEKALTDAGMKDVIILGRPKHLWSVYRKMMDKGLAFDEIHDLIAFRVLLDNLSQCYEALGNIHAKWRPIPGRFKDYIAMPKPNGYRSLHTTVVGPKGERIEVQIRTKRMNEVAESGIAAHWKYKASGSSKLTIDDSSEKSFQWLRQLMNWQRDLSDPNEFLESVKVDLFADEVYVFTPRGDVIELPRGATPVDLAFAIHSDVGMQCIGAKVNNRIVPLRYILENGDNCEIITQKNQRPKKDWLDFVKTSRARTKIRAMMRQIERDRSKDIGKELLDKEFRRFGTSLIKEIKSSSIDKALKEKHCANLDEALALVGYGKLDAKSLVEICLPEEKKLDLADQRKSRIGELFQKLARRGSDGIRVEGIDDVLVHYARCCGPVKGDPVIGFITRGRGVTIHRRNCAKILSLDVDRRINVTWVSESQNIRPISITVVTDDREGMLTELSSVFARMNINISEAKCKGMGDGLAINTFKCGIVDLDQLKQVMRKISALKGVHRVERSASIE